MIYFAKIEKQDNKNFLIEFPELPGCLSEAKSLKEALVNAKEALDGWLTSNCDRNLSIPEPKNRRSKNYFPIEADLRISFAIVLRKARKSKKMSQSQVAERLGISQQAYAKLETPTKTNPSLSTIHKLSKVLSFELELSLAA